MKATQVVSLLLEDDPKDEILDRPPPESVIRVESSHGTFSIDPRNGDVIEWNPANPEDEDAINMAQIRQFDLVKWSEQGRPEDSPGVIDILDLGYWLMDGSYEPPEDKDWRMGENDPDEVE